jgi:hypothetical protein
VGVKRISGLVEFEIFLTPKYVKVRLAIKDTLPTRNENRALVCKKFRTL